MNKILIIIYMFYIILDMFKKVIFVDRYDRNIFIFILFLAFNRQGLGISEIMVISLAVFCYLVNFIFKKITTKRYFIVSRFDKSILERYKIKILKESKKEKIIVVEKNQVQLLATLKNTARNYTLGENIFGVVIITVLSLIAFYIPV